MLLLDVTTEEVFEIICKCSNSAVDWSQFLPSMIATFFGFVLALIGATLTGLVTKRIKISKLRNRVFFELAQFYIDITENDDSVLSYDYPIWDSVISSSILLDIGDNGLLSELSNLYGQIKVLAQLEESDFAEGVDNTTPSKQILKKRRETAAAILSSTCSKNIQLAIDKLRKNSSNVKDGKD